MHRTARARITRTTLRTALLGTLAVIVAGCGGGSDSDKNSASSATLKAGKVTFVQKCGSCHTLSDAGTSGEVGPELDHLGLTNERVTAQIASGGGAMPPQLVSGHEAAQVAAYVAQASGG